MFRLILFLAVFLLCVFFWQDISPYFQRWTDNFDTFMLYSHDLMVKILDLFGESDTLSDSIQQIQQTEEIDIQDTEPSKAPPTE